MCTCSGERASSVSVLLVGTVLMQSLDHLMLWHTAGGDWRAVVAIAEREACRASVKWGRAAVICRAIVLAPPQITRFPFVVHLMAEVHI